MDYETKWTWVMVLLGIMIGILIIIGGLFF